MPKYNYLMRFLSLNHIIKIIILAALILVFWCPVISNNEFFMDDLTFLNVFKTGQPSLSYFFAPHNEHFMPMFKLIFYSAYEIFGLNIALYMGLSIILHMINCSFLYLLLTLIFKERKNLPFLLTLFFGLNTAYFEILHWFTIFSQALVMFFLLSTLLLLHISQEKKDKRLFYMALASSFFIPMNFSLGFLGIIFIALYNYFIIDLKSRKFNILPFFIVWAVYLVIYLYFTLHLILTKSSAVSINIANALQFTFFGFFGLLIKLLGFSALIFPYTTGIAIFLSIALFFFVVFFLLYFVLNSRKSRIAFFKEWRISLFAFLGMFLSYSMIAAGRTSLSADAFFNWGRYHYIPMLFLTILIGAIIPQIIEILSLVYSKKRVKAMLIILLILLLVNHFILIRQKSESTIRLEGIVPSITLLV